MTILGTGDDQHRFGDLDVIRSLARTLDDLEHLRVATAGRVRASGIDIPDSSLVLLLDALETQEHKLRLAIQKTWKKHYLYPWSSTLKGVKGGTLLPRLIAELGDPYIATPMAGFRTPEGAWTVVADGEPYARTLRQLWRYCGLGDVNDKPKRGATQEEARQGGRAIIRKRVWLIADQFIRHRTEPYRSIYDTQKAAKVEAGWKLGHAENHARRIVMKEFLRELWRAARAVQWTDESQSLSGDAGGTEPGAIQRVGEGHCSPGRSRELVSV